MTESMAGWFVRLTFFCGLKPEEKKEVVNAIKEFF